MMFEQRPIGAPGGGGDPELDHLELRLLDLQVTERVERPAALAETLVLLLSGAAEVWPDDRDEAYSLAGRDDVFAGPGPSVYVPPGVGYSIKARARTEVAEVAVAAADGPPSYAILADEVAVEERGKGPARREVRTVIDHTRPAARLIVGETLNEPGGWSSYPPHKHDESTSTETRLSELYHLRFDPPVGFGFARRYEVGGADEAVVVHDRTTFRIPRGYHTIVAAPGYRLYYLWALAGDGRHLCWTPDPLLGAAD